jgi:two-component system response regulator HydG
LRERRDDIPLLINTLLARFARRHGRKPAGIASRAMQALMHHAWPGNVRELENVLERAIILIQGEELIDINHLSNADDTLNSPSYFGIGYKGQLETSSDIATAKQRNVTDTKIAASVDALADSLVQQGMAHLPGMEDALVRAAIRQTDGNITRAANILGLTRSQLDYRHKKIDPTK